MSCTATCHRVGRIGCNILLGQIPQPAPISIVTNGEFQSRGKIGEAYKRLQPLEKLQIEKPGRTLAVLNVVRFLGKIEFKRPVLYAHCEELAKLHPESHHVDEKIRQQLQELRDMGILKFVEPEFYRLL
jgi:type II restriction enzyme